MVTREESPSDWPVNNDITRNPTGTGRSIAFVMGPDDQKGRAPRDQGAEGARRTSTRALLRPQTEEMQAWYIKVFGAKAGAPGGRFLTAALPGVTLNFQTSPGPVVGTQGRVTDHVGFEIDNLPEFLKKLEAMGIKAANVREVPDLGASIAFITDPWGTYIELTEGLDKIQ
jgi:catechol 2,3-dioxygenase-like lactoylglutathione lyase family enzyme